MGNGRNIGLITVSNHDGLSR